MRLTWSAARSLWVAEMMPRGTASTVERRAAARASSTVAGQRCSRTRLMAGRLCRFEGRRGAEKGGVLLVERAVEAEEMTRVGDLFPGRALIHEKRAGITGEANEEEHGGGQG